MYRHLFLFLLACARIASAAAEDTEFFEKKVRPVLVERCYTCHSADTQPHGELRVDDRAGLIAGGNSGPAVVPGHPERSLLIERLTTTDPRRRMPRESAPLAPQQIADIAKWIADGVAWPSEQFPARYGHSEQQYTQLRTRHWAWQPLTEHRVPEVVDNAWPAAGAAGDIDRFVSTKLTENRLKPVPDADRLTLIRRVSFDLRGLPPTPPEIQAFLKDPSPRAYEQLVDRFLDSPAFGERWGREWLDVARYGESTGPSRNVPYPFAWRYRDYVIDAFNRDVPFDKFIREQIAGDLLPADTASERDRLNIATGFLALGPKDVNERFKERFLMDNVAEKIDTVSRSVLALTVACARCHDHKFDPIPTADYYALAGIFRSTEDDAGVRSKMGGDGLDYYDPKLLLTLASYTPVPDDQKLQELRRNEAAAQKAWEDVTDTPEALEPVAGGKTKEEVLRKTYQDMLTQLQAAEDPGTLGYGIHGVREGAIGDTAIRIRGEAERVGPVASRGFLTAFQVSGAKSVAPNHSGRLEFADWLTSPQNPLTPRVAVNRIWEHLFGRGIVSTVDNFGFMGDRPSNPALLDYLASRFVQDGWSTKRMVRTLVLTRTYRLGSSAPAKYRDIDPENRYNWRHSPRRLDAEEIRDAILQSSGELQPGPPPAAPVRQLKMIEIQDNGPEALKMRQAAGASSYRSVYLPLLRGVAPDSLDAFDPVTQTLVTGQRDSTTVPTQALFLLNSAFARRRSLSLGDRLLATNETARQAIGDAYWLILNRPPAERELARGETFIGDYALASATGARDVPVIGARNDPDKSAPKKENAAGADDEARLAGTVLSETVQPKTSRDEAWMSFIQALYASAEFRFVR